MADEDSKKTLNKIPLLKTKAGPRDKELWPQRLKEEYQALIQVTGCQYVLSFTCFFSIQHKLFP